MAKLILKAIILSFTLLFVPAMEASAEMNAEIMSVETQNIRIEKDGSGIRIIGAQGKVARIYNLVGVQIMAVSIDSADKFIDLSQLQRGLYPIRVGNISKRIQVD